MIATIFAACGGFMGGWVARSLLASRSDAMGLPPRGSNPAPPGAKPAAPAGPPPPPASSGGRPGVIPPGTRSITFPDAAADRRPINPYTGRPAAPAGPPLKPQFPPPRAIREDFLPHCPDTIAAIRAADAAISDQALEAELRAWWRSQGWPAGPGIHAVQTHIAWGRHLLARGVQP